MTKIGINGFGRIGRIAFRIAAQNKDVEIGSYPFFRAGKLGVAIVIRSIEQSKIDICNAQILDFVNQKNIQIIINE